jgi:predicted nucleic acid-binding protein
MKKFGQQLRLMAGKRVYIDTNIFIYFFNKWDKGFPLVADFIEACANRQIFGVASELVMAEILVQPYRERHLETIAQVKGFFGQKDFLHVCEHQSGFMNESAMLAGELGMKLIDAMHFHTAIANRCDFLITHDQNFKSTRGVEVVQLQDFIG